MSSVVRKISLEAMEPYLGRLVKFVTIDDDHIRVGFLSAIRNGQFILDDTEPVSHSKVVAAYNIVNKKIAGEGPEVYERV